MVYNDNWEMKTLWCNFAQRSKYVMSKINRRIDMGEERTVYCDYHTMRK